MFNQVTPAIIEPCATVLNEHGSKILSEFHLLSCGHVVGVDDTDQRCGRNCQHAVTTIARLLVRSNVTTLSTIAYRVPAESTIQNIDILYCEICNGIPIERYRKMRLEPDGAPSTIRRSLAVTRAMIQSLHAVSIEQVDDMFCFPYFCSSVQDCDGQHAHKLRCGHLVWSPSPRSCASNCVNWYSTRRVSPVTWVRQGDAILCHECEGRAELVYRRFAQGVLGMRHRKIKDIFD